MLMENWGTLGLVKVACDGGKSKQKTRVMPRIASSIFLIKLYDTKALLEEMAIKGFLYRFLDYV
jgi:hypothetical protein